MSFDFLFKKKNEGFEYIFLSSAQDTCSFSRAGQKSGEGKSKTQTLRNIPTLCIIY